MKAFIPVIVFALMTFGLFCFAMENKCRQYVFFVAHPNLCINPKYSPSDTLQYPGGAQ